ncbi:MAG: alpha/beta hydrolase [Acidobacteriaceae bacterium]|nr:alpha/beta hydrolase [Acidobacteriaceae bacterium]
MTGKIVDRFVFYPMRYPQGDWELRQVSGAEERWFMTADGIRLNAWWFPKSDAELVTLFLHGNAGNVTHRVHHAQAVLAAGSALLVPDYRGYGKSQGHPSENGLYTDATAAYAELERLGYRPDQILIQGESLGTAVAVELATRNRCRGIVLESPLKSLSAMAAGVVPVFGSLVARGFNTYNKIRHVHAPLLVIHGEADEIVPISQGVAVCDAANEPKQLWRVPGAHHNDLLYVAGSEYIVHLRQFYKSIADLHREYTDPAQ